MSQFFLNVDDLKRICPNLNMDRVVLQVSDDVNINNSNPTQQYMLNENNVILNKNPQIICQQAGQLQQNSSTHQIGPQYIVQQSDDLLQQQTQQRQTMIQQQLHNQQQPSHLYYTNEPILQQQNQQQPSQQIVYRAIAQQPQTSQNSSQVVNSQHVVIQQVPQQVIIQQSGSVGQTQQIVMRQQLSQQRIIYTASNNTVLYTPPSSQHQMLQPQQLGQNNQNQQTALQHQRTPSTRSVNPQQHLHNPIVFHPVPVQNIQHQSPQLPATSPTQVRGITRQIRMLVPPPVRATKTAVVRSEILENKTRPRAIATRGNRGGRGGRYTARLPTSSIRIQKPQLPSPVSIQPIRPNLTGPTVRQESSEAPCAATKMYTNFSPTGTHLLQQTQRVFSQKLLGTGLKTSGNIVAMPTTSNPTTVTSNITNAGTLTIATNTISDAKTINNTSTNTSASSVSNLQAPITMTTTTTPVGTIRTNSKFRITPTKHPATTSNALSSINTIPVSSTNNISTHFSPVGDIEESIQAVLVSRTNDQTKAVQQKSNLGTTLTTYSTDPEENKTVQLQNGTSMTLSEFKKRQNVAKQNIIQVPISYQNHSQIQPTMPKMPFHRLSNVQQNKLTTKEIGSGRSVNEHGSSIVRTSHNNYEIQTLNVIQNRGLQKDPNIDNSSAKMLVILASGEQRLITFTLPRDSCSVQDLLEQVGVPFDSTTTIQCVENPGANIDFVVSVGFSVQETSSELISRVEQSMQMNKQLDGSVTGIPTKHTPQQLKQLKAIPVETNKSGVNKIDGTIPLPSKIITGFLAVCLYCGFSGCDHAKCERCKRVFLESPRRVPANKNIPVKSAEEEKRRLANIEIQGRSQVKTFTATPVRGGRTLINSTKRVVRAEVEPIILTLSSDDEGDNEKAAKILIQQNNEKISWLKPLVFEPTLLDDDYPNGDTINFARCNVTDLSNSNEKISTLIHCKLIRIGTYRFEPMDMPIITSKGIRICAPKLNKELEQVILNICTKEIVKILTHFSKKLNVIFIYTFKKCGEYIRECLDLQLKTNNTMEETPYFNPTDRLEPYKRIIFLVDSISDESKAAIKSIFEEPFIKDISFIEANELLKRASSKDKFLDAGASTINTSNEPAENIRQILIYPPGKGGISINTEDYMCLGVDQYLNDVIIDFYLKFVHLNMLEPLEQEKTHIFSTFFYKRLTTMAMRNDNKLSAAKNRHSRVQNWTKNVNLFEKDFIIIPINEQAHWFLAIICFPQLKGPVNSQTNEPVTPQTFVKKKKTDEKILMQIGNTTITPLIKKENEMESGNDEESEKGDDSELASEDSDFESSSSTSSFHGSSAIKQPVILVFDSLMGASRARVAATLRDYLTCEYQAKMKETYVFNKTNMPSQVVKVPQQNNYTDCGLYLLQYVEHFFKYPIVDYHLPIKQMFNWFDTLIVTQKREDISELLKSLVAECNPEKLPLPCITLPTCNGKLIEEEESLNGDIPDFEGEAEGEGEGGGEEDDDFDESLKEDVLPTVSEMIKSTTVPTNLLKRSLEDKGISVSPTMKKVPKLESME